MNELQGIGYWIDPMVRDYNEAARKCNEHLLKLPDPHRLQAMLGPQPADPLVVAYLRSGRELMACLGFSYCRFGCGIEDERMGCRDLTDGTWVWPEGLFHYVEAHQVPLPQPFLATMAGHGWQVPAEAGAIEETRGWSLAFWQQWYQDQIDITEE